MLSNYLIRAIRIGLQTSLFVFIFWFDARPALGSNTSIAWPPEISPSSKMPRDATLDACAAGPVDKNDDFYRQVGLGLTIIPIQKLWKPTLDTDYFQGGGTFDLSFRAHPRLTIDFSVGGTGNAEDSSSGIHRAEFLASLGPRIYINQQPTVPHVFHQMYYVILAGQFNINILGISSPYGDSIDGTFGLGFLAGVGFELRFNSHWVMSVDTRAVIRGQVSPGVGSDSFEVGVRLGIGFSYFFQKAACRYSSRPL